MQLEKVKPPASVLAKFGDGEWYQVDDDPRRYTMVIACVHGDLRFTKFDPDRVISPLESETVYLDTIPSDARHPFKSGVCSCGKKYWA